MDEWDRQRDENGKLEPMKAFEYFNEYLIMDKPRSLRGLIKQLNKKPTFLSQLGKYSSTWNWVKRAEAYDEYICLQKREQKEQLYIELVESELPELIKQFGIVNDNIDNLGVDTGSVGSISKGLEQSSRAKKNLMEIFLTLAGKPKEYTDNKHEVDSTIVADVDVESKQELSVFDIVNLVDGELGDVYEENIEKSED